MDPTINALLINFRVSSDAEILLVSTIFLVPNVPKRACNMLYYILPELGGWGEKLIQRNQSAFGRLLMARKFKLF